VIRRYTIGYGSLQKRLIKAPNVWCTPSLLLTFLFIDMFTAWIHIILTTMFQSFCCDETRYLSWSQCNFPINLLYQKLHTFQRPSTTHIFTIILWRQLVFPASQVREVLLLVTRVRILQWNAFGRKIHKNYLTVVYNMYVCN